MRENSLKYYTPETYRYLSVRVRVRVSWKKMSYCNNEKERFIVVLYVLI